MGQRSCCDCPQGREATGTPSTANSPPPDVTPDKDPKLQAVLQEKEEMAAKLAELQAENSRLKKGMVAAAVTSRKTFEERHRGLLIEDEQKHMVRRGTGWPSVKRCIIHCGGLKSRAWQTAAQRLTVVESHRNFPFGNPYPSVSNAAEPEPKSRCAQSINACRIAIIGHYNVCSSSPPSCQEQPIKVLFGPTH